MKVKSTAKKMHGIGFLSFAKEPNNPLDSKGKVINPIISKDEFRKLKKGKEINISGIDYDKISKRFPELLKIVYNEEPKKPEIPAAADGTPTRGAEPVKNAGITDKKLDN